MQEVENGLGVARFAVQFECGRHAMVPFNDMIDAASVSHTGDSTAWFLVGVRPIAHVDLYPIHQAWITQSNLSSANDCMWSSETRHEDAHRFLFRKQPG